MSFSSSLQHQFGVASADREKKRFSISAGRIEMGAMHCCWHCWVVHFFFVVYRVLRLSRILSACFLSFLFFFFILENFVHGVYRLDTVRKMRHAICNGFQRQNIFI